MRVGAKQAWECGRSRQLQECQGQSQDNTFNKYSFFMGNQTASQWQLIQTFPSYNVVLHSPTNTLFQQYSLHLDKNAFLTFRHSIQQRIEIACPHAIQPHTIEISGREEMCASYLPVHVYCQRIQRLSDHKSALTFEQACFLLKQAARGYDELKPFYGLAYDVDHHMFGINEKNEVKVWMSDRSCDCWPSLPFKWELGMADCQHNFCTGLIRVVEKHGPSFTELKKQLKLPFKLSGIASYLNKLNLSQNPFAEPASSDSHNTSTPLHFNLRQSDLIQPLFPPSPPQPLRFSIQTHSHLDKGFNDDCMSDIPMTYSSTHLRKLSQDHSPQASNSSFNAHNHKNQQRNSDQLSLIEEEQSIGLSSPNKPYAAKLVTFLPPNNI